MRQFRLVLALTLAVVGAAAVAQAQGKPGNVPVGPPSTPVQGPETPANPPLTQWVCSWLPVPYLCD